MSQFLIDQRVTAGTEPAEVLRRPAAFEAVVRAPRILFLLPRFHTNLFEATRALSQRGYQLSACCEEAAALEDYRHLQPEILTAGQLGWREIFRRLRQWRPDLIVIRQSEGRWRRFLWLAQLLSIPTLGYDLRPLHRPRSAFTRCKEFLRGKPLRRFTPVLGAPDAAVDRDAYYLPFPVRTPLLPQAREYLPEGRLRVLCVGKLAQPRKRHFLLIDALEALQADDRIELTIVGSSALDCSNASAGYLRRLAERAESSRLPIRILADRPYAEMSNLYRAHDLCVLPARHEPLGMAPLEALAQGCVPIVTDECGSAACIESGRQGFVFKADDEAALRSILAGLVGNRCELERLGRNAAAHAAQEFGAARFVERFERICAGT